MPVHIPGIQNLKADAHSWAKISPAEWELIPRVTHHLFTHWKRPEIDLFATDKNRKLDLFCARIPLPGVYHVNSLVMNWSCVRGYAFPPLALIPLVLQKVKQDEMPSVILVAPVWKRRS